MDFYKFWDALVVKNPKLANAKEVSLTVDNLKRLLMQTFMKGEEFARETIKSRQKAEDILQSIFKGHGT